MATVLSYKRSSLDVKQCGDLRLFWTKFEPYTNKLDKNHQIYASR